MVGYAKRLEVGVGDNTPNLKTNSAGSDYIKSHTPSDTCYDNATNLSTYMTDKEEDVDIIQEVPSMDPSNEKG